MSDEITESGTVSEADGPTGTSRVLLYIAGAFLLLFAVLWAILCLRVLASGTKVSLSDAVVTTAGFIATTVATGTAAVLGITIKEASNNTDSNTSFAQATATQLSGSKMTVAGVMTYLVVGFAVLATWLIKGDIAPDLFKAFGLTVLGWAGGAFGSVFKANPTK
jgi:hypothetical protein